MGILKKIFYSTIILTIIVILVYFNVESVQKKVFDTKADLVGTNRTVSFYSFDGKVVNSYSDKSVRFESLPTGGISVWLGSSNKKVHSNMDYIIEDK